MGNLGGARIVLQPVGLYCNLGAGQGWTVLRYSAQPCHDTATVAATRRACWGAGACGRAQGERGACVGGAGGSWAQQALGERARCRREGSAEGAAGSRAAGARGEHGRARSARGRAGWAAGARPGRWAHGLALGCALSALSLFSIRFDSVLFLSRFLDIVREPG